MYRLFVVVAFISGCLSQNAVYNNVCKTLIETFDCSHGFQSKKLCGTDGTIYETECDFAIAHCRNPRLDVDLSRSCDGSSVVSGSLGSGLMTTRGQDQTTAGQVNTVSHGQGHSPTTAQAMTTTITTTTTMVPPTLSQICKILVAATCPDTKTEVCGTDKETYDNMCKFEIAKCHDQTLAVDHQGLCNLNAVDIICKTVKDKPCPAETEIVCGSDGKTYTNLCEFDKGKCFTPGLKLAGIGKC